MYRKLPAFNYEFICPFVSHPDIVRVSPRMYNKIVFQTSIFGVIAQIYIRINIFIGYGLINFTISAPFGMIISDKIIIIGIQWFITCNLYLVPAVYKLHLIELCVHDEA